MYGVSSHNVPMIGPPGSGKTLMARCMPTIQPDMTFEVALEATLIHFSDTSDAIRARVEAARRVQLARYKDIGIHCNAELNARTLASVCALTRSAKALLTATTEKMKLSNRAYTRILKVARTICDLDGVEEIGDEQIAEAVQYRTLDRKYWG